MEALFNVGDAVVITSQKVMGWIEDIFYSQRSSTYVYAVKDAEDDHIYFVSEFDINPV